MAQKKTQNAKPKASLAKLSQKDHLDKITTMIIGFVVGGLVLGFLIGYFGIYQTILNINQINQDKDAYEAHTEELEESMSNTEAVSSDLNSRSQTKENILSLLPQTLREEQLLQFLSVSASDASVFLASYEPQPINLGASGGDTPASVANEYPFEVAVTGSYENIRNFISTLENGSRFVSVREVQFAVDNNTFVTGEQQGPQMSISLSAVAYSQQSLSESEMPVDDEAPVDGEDTEASEGVEEE